MTPPGAPHRHARLSNIPWVVLLAAALGAGIPAGSAQAKKTPLPAAPEAVEVVGIADGDTIRVLLGGSELRVRLFGVDCPEKEQPFFARARQFTSDLAFRKKVRLTPRDWDDRYPDRPRLVAQVQLPDGRDLGSELLRGGMAHAFRRYLKGEGAVEREYIALEQEARAARRGIWSEPGPVPPWEHRSRGREAAGR